MRVLVIDDEPDVLLLCRVNLEYAGHEVLEAADAEQGLEVAASELPDLIVLDVMLPTRDGIEVLRELRARPTSATTPVVLLTAKARTEDQLRGWRAGCSEYVTKPFSPAAFAQVLDEVISMTPDELLARRAQAIAGLGG